MSKIKLFKLFQYMFLLSLLISGCNTSVDANKKVIEKENKKLTLHKQDSVTNTSKETNLINDQDKLQGDILIEDLADGNYRFCSKPASVEDINGFDGEAWCFEFNKYNSNVVGTYSYQAPKDTAQICIEGVAKGDQVNGVGYEMIQYDETKPDIEKEKLQFSQFTSKRDFWDDSDVYQGGFNLKVGSPHFHQLIEPEQEGNSYWAWIRFDIVELNLRNFYQRELRKYNYLEKVKEIIPVSKCVN